METRRKNRNPSEMGKRLEEAINKRFKDSSNGVAALAREIAKYPNTASVFDPYYGEEEALSFTRKRTEYFDEKPFATDAANGDTSE